MLTARVDNQLPAPKWVDRSSGVTLTIFGRVDEGIKRFTANPRQLELLAELPFGGQIRPGEYHRRYAADVSDRQARRDLVELEDAGMLLRIGKGASTVFQRTKRT